MGTTLTGRVARLLWQPIHEQTQEYNISFSTIWIGSSSRRESVLVDKRGVHIVKHVGPNFSGIWHRKTYQFGSKNLWEIYVPCCSFPRSLSLLYLRGLIVLRVENILLAPDNMNIQSLRISLTNLLSMDNYECLWDCYRPIVLA